MPGTFLTRWVTVSFIKKCSIVYGQLYHYSVPNIGKGKGKDHPKTGHEGPEREERYSPTLDLTLALDGG
jgi:hypothetical protein